MGMPGWLKCAAVGISFTISAIDIASDWYATAVLLMFDIRGVVTIAYCFVCAVATLLFFSECILARAHCKEEEDDTRTRLRDFLSFGLLVVEDLGCLIILFSIYKWATCLVYFEMTEDTFAAKFAMIASILSCAWKSILCLKYCGSQCSDGRCWYTRKIFRFVLGAVLLVLFICLFQAFMPRHSHCMVEITSPTVEVLRPTSSFDKVDIFNGSVDSSGDFVNDTFTPTMDTLLGNVTAN